MIEGLYARANSNLSACSLRPARAAVRAVRTLARARDRGGWPFNREIALAEAGGQNRRPRRPLLSRPRDFLPVFFQPADFFEA
jgi:hypothetical protein